MRVWLSCVWVGAAAITIQLLALNHLNRIFGATSASFSVALAAALAGLAWGAWFWCRESVTLSRRTGVFRLFLGAGLAALMCIGAPTVVELIQGWLSFGFAPGSWRAHLARLLYGLFVVFPASAMLGGIVPKLAFHQSHSKSSAEPRSADQRLARLYALETLGAAIGGLCSGAWAIHVLGAAWTTAVVAVGCFTLAASWWFGDLTDQEEVLRSSKQAPRHSRRSSQEYGWLAAVCVAGCASLAMEIVWVRLLVMLVGSDSLSYALVSATYLVGIGVGSHLASYLPGKSGSMPHRFAWLQLALVWVIVVQLQTFLFISNGSAQQWLQQSSAGGFGPLTGRLILCLCVETAGAILVGTSFAFAARGYVEEVYHGGTSQAGRLYAGLTIGNVLGVILTGLFFIPLLGLQKSLWVLAGMALVAGWIGLFVSSKVHHADARRDRSRTTSVALPFGLALTSLSIVLGFYSPKTPIGLSQESEAGQVEYYREGPVATVAVVKSRDGWSKRMVLDGIIIGESSGGVDEKQQMLSALPALLGPQESDQSVLTIGLGTGILAGQLANQEQVKQVTCIELSESVVQAAGRFSDTNSDALNHAKISHHHGDGLQYLRHSRDTYQAIVSDAKSLPGHSANVAFFSADYYQLCKSRLATGGLFAQWISLDSPPDEIEIILHTFASSFENGYVGIAAPDSLYLIGLKDIALELVDGRIDTYLQGPNAATLREYGWQSHSDIRSMLWISSQEVKEWLGPTTSVNSLDRPVLGALALQVLTQSRKTFKVENLRQLVTWLENTPERFNRNSLTPPEAMESTETRLDYRQVALEIIHACIAITEKDDNWLLEATDRFHQACRLVGDLHRQRLVAEQWIETAQRDGSGDQILHAYAQAAKLLPDNPELHHRLALLLKSRNRREEAVDHFHRAQRLNPENVVYRTDFAIGLAAIGKMKLASNLLREVLEVEPQCVAAQFGYGVVLWTEGRIEEADSYLRRAVSLDPALAAEVERLGIRMN